MMPSSIIIRVLGWDTDHSWVDWSDYHRKYLEKRLTAVTDLDKSTAKQLAREIRDKKRADIRLSASVDPFDAESLASFLESLGAAVKVEADNA